MGTRWFFLLAFVANFAAHATVLTRPPFFEDGCGVWTEADYLRTHGFDYRALHQEPSFPDGGPKNYFITVVPGVIGGIMSAAPSPRWTAVVAHLLSFLAVSTMLTAVYAIARRALVDPTAVWLVAIVLFFYPLFFCQAEQSNLDVYMCAVGYLAFLAWIVERPALAIVLSVVAFSMKATGMLVTCAVLAAEAGWFAATAIYSRSLRGWMNGALAALLGIVAFLGETAVLGWAGTKHFDPAVRELSAGAEGYFSYAPLLCVLAAISALALVPLLFRSRRGTTSVRDGRCINVAGARALCLFVVLALGHGVAVVRYGGLATRHVTILTGAVLLSFAIVMQWRFGFQTLRKSLAAVGIVTLLSLVSGLVIYEPYAEAHGLSYRTWHLGMIGAMRAIDATNPHVPVVAGHPYLEYMTHPALGYVTKPRHGYTINTFVDPAFKGVEHLLVDLPRRFYCVRDNCLYYQAAYVNLVDLDHRRVIYDSGGVTVEEVELPTDWSPAQKRSWYLEQCFADTRRRLRVSPSNRASLLAASGLLLEAIAMLEIELKANPGDTTSRAALARLLLHNNDVWAARTQAQEVLKANPNEPSANEALGEALLSQNEPKAAKEHLESALRGRPDSLRARCLLALALMRMGDLRSALAATDRAVALAPRERLPWETRLLILCQTGDRQTLKETCRKLVALAPNNVEAGAILLCLLDQDDSAEERRQVLAQLGRQRIDEQQAIRIGQTALAKEARRQGVGLVD